MAAPRSHKMTASALSLLILAMAGLTAASVPLYEIFCRVTGYGGTTQVAEDLAPEALEQTIKVRFDASIGDQLPWQFQPVEREIEVRLGEERLAFYRAVNVSDRPIVGTASIQCHTGCKAGAVFHQDRMLLLSPSRCLMRLVRRTDMPVSSSLSTPRSLMIANDPGISRTSRRSHSPTPSSSWRTRPRSCRRSFRERAAGIMTMQLSRDISAVGRAQTLGAIGHVD